MHKLGVVTSLPRNTNPSSRSSCFIMSRIYHVRMCPRYWSGQWHTRQRHVNPWPNSDTNVGLKTIHLFPHRQIVVITDSSDHYDIIVDRWQKCHRESGRNLMGISSHGLSDNTILVPIRNKWGDLTELVSSIKTNCGNLQACHGQKLMDEIFGIGPNLSNTQSQSRHSQSWGSTFPQVRW